MLPSDYPRNWKQARFDPMVCVAECAPAAVRHLAPSASEVLRQLSVSETCWVRSCETDHNGLAPLLQPPLKHMCTFFRIASAAQYVTAGFEPATSRPIGVATKNRSPEMWASVKSWLPVRPAPYINTWARVHIFFSSCACPELFL